MGNGQWAMEGLDPEEPAYAGFSESGPINDFRDLDVWKEGMALAVAIYRTTSKFPREELYGLTSQMRRAAVSIPTNIAEGYGRDSSGAYIQFLKIALGSAKELETLVELAFQHGFADKAAAPDSISRVQRICRMLLGLIRAIEVRRR